VFNNSTDKDWEKFGRDDPYFGVLTDEKYLSSNLNEASRDEFFRSGEAYIEYILTVIRERVDPGYAVARALDFGCGVGRLVIPLASRAREVTGVDVSEAMLAEARKNCDARSLGNVALVTSDDGLSRVPGTYNLIHSFIVFQHIPVARGERIFSRMVDLLEDGGVGVMHFTYAKDYEVKGLVPWIKNYIPLASNVINWIKGRGFFYYGMQMNAYDMNPLLLILQKAGVVEFFTEFTHSIDEFGVILYFRKPSHT